jgi:hypothetical protein
MTDHKGLPVAGYQPQSDEKVQLVNEFKADEERLLRKLDGMKVPSQFGLGGKDTVVAHDLSPLMTGEKPQGGGNSQYEPLVYDQRWLAIARTHFQEGFMALNRAVFQPQRIKLPEDE